MTLALGGLVAGFVHVLSGPDHLAAIAPYAVKEKRRAWLTGMRWGLGHTAGVLVVGVLALMLRHALPVAAQSAWSERCVGLVLVGIGIWGIRAALLRRVHTHEHLHDEQPHVYIHLHGRSSLQGTAGGHTHTHAAFAVGTLHGLAGSSHLLGILPALALPSNLMAGAYLLLFGTGSIAAMGAFASLVGWTATRATANGARAYSTTVL
jgi:ABC-type nickel/cobalt efflux system permease component RcnA